MKRLIIILFLLFVSLHFVFASCSEGQIDINSATLSQLDEIKWVGESTAQNIINSRPFDSVDDLVDIKYITLERVEEIKLEGLACVADKDSNSQEENKEQKIEEKEIESEDVKKETESETEDKIEEENPEEILELNSEIKEESSKKETKLKTIELNSISSQTIKSENYTEDKSKSDYATYGLLGFCVLLCFLFVLKKNKYRKNEFK